LSKGLLRLHVWTDNVCVQRALSYRALRRHCGNDIIQLHVRLPSWSVRSDDRVHIRCLHWVVSRWYLLFDGGLIVHTVSCWSFRLRNRENDIGLHWRLCGRVLWKHYRFDNLIVQWSVPPRKVFHSGIGDMQRKLWSRYICICGYRSMYKLSSREVRQLIGSRDECLQWRL
jgi:hypothetical protein